MSPKRLLAAHYLQHFLDADGLEIQAIGAVEIGGHGFGVAIDHDAGVALLADRHGGVDAAIVEFDALANAVGSAAEDDDAALGCINLQFAFVVVAGVHIGAAGGEFTSAAVDVFEYWVYAELPALCAHISLAAGAQRGDIGVAKAHALPSAELLGAQFSQSQAEISFSALMISSICARNQGSIKLSL